MLDNTPPPAPPESLFDRSLIAAAYVAHTDAHARVAAHDAQIVAAQHDLAVAQAARTDLLTRAADGGGVTPDATARAEAAVRDAEAHTMFLREARAILASRAADAAAGIDAAQRAAALPIALHGAKLRLDASRRIAAALAALADAEAAYDRGTTFLSAAGGRGWQPAGGSGAGLIPPPMPRPLADQYATMPVRHPPAVEESLLRRAGLLADAPAAAA